MDIIKFVPDKFNAIAAAMNSGISLEELEHMHYVDVQKSRTRYFIMVDGVWSLVNERVLEHLMTALISMNE